MKLAAHCGAAHLKTVTFPFRGVVRKDCDIIARLLDVCEVEASIYGPAKTDRGKLVLDFLYFLAALVDPI